MEGKISIIVPVYKAEEYLPQCLDSLLAQTWQDLEIWLVDDGSPDSSGEICDAYARKDPRFHVVHQKNQGVSAARNAALSLVTGDYVGFMDADDWAEPDLYESLLLGFSRQSSETESPAMSMCSFYLNEQDSYYPCGRKEPALFSGTEALFFILTDKLSSLWDKLFLTSRIREKSLFFDSSLTVCEDLLFVFEYLKGGSLAYQPLPLYHYRQSDGSITRSGFSVSRMSLLTALSRIEEQIPAEHESLRQVVQSRHVYDSIVLIILLLIDRNPPENRKELEKQLQGNIRRNLGTFLLSKGYTIIDKAASILLSIHPGFFAQVYRILYRK